MKEIARSITLNFGKVNALIGGGVAIHFYCDDNFSSIILYASMRNPILANSIGWSYSAGGRYLGIFEDFIYTHLLF